MAVPADPPAAPSAASPAPDPVAPTLARWLFDRLKAAGVSHVFGIPGDYALGLFDAAEKSGLRLINSCDEQGAGFAADAYARLTGLGVVLVTYGVGGLKLVNSTAQAYAERSPVVVISGAPGLGERANDPLLHHRVKDFDSQKRVFAEVTRDSAALDDLATAPAIIDRLIATARQRQRPVYLEIPRDLANGLVIAAAASPPVRSPAIPSPAVADSDALNDAVEDAADLLNSAASPIILAGVELHRFGLGDALGHMLDHSAIPFATTIMGKSLLPETRSGFVGVYMGAMSSEPVRQAVEGSDGLLLAGAMLTDLNTGIFTADLKSALTVSATADGVRVRRAHYPHVRLDHFMTTLSKRLTPRGNKARPVTPEIGRRPAFTAMVDAPLTTERLFDCVNAHLGPHTIVLAEAGDALFGAADLVVHEAADFLASAYYASLGFAVPGAIGAQCARPHDRPLVLVGDGAFQMTGMEITMAARYGLDPIVLILNNRGYGTERPMLDGTFNDVHPWAFARLPDIIGAGWGVTVQTEEALDQALSRAGTIRQIAIIEALLDPADSSPALQRLTARLRERVVATD